MKEKWRGPMRPAKITSEPPDLQNDLQAQETVSMPLTTSPGLRHFVYTPRILSPLTIFIFCLPFMALPTKNQNISLQSSLLNSLKNCLINKF